LSDWQQNGTWDLIHFALLDWFTRDGQADWSRAVVDGCQCEQFLGTADRGKSQQIRRSVKGTYGVISHTTPQPSVQYGEEPPLNVVP
jgi:hypothetical protein